MLFDIDGTLLDSGGAGMKSLAKAFSDIYGIENAFAGISMAGKTDPHILKEALEKFELSHADGTMPRLTEAYLKHLGIEIQNDRRYMMPGVKSLLDELSGHPDFCMGLLTGNIKQGALIKLEAFAINGYFGIGAFGDDNEDRNKLLPIALKRAREQYNLSASYEDCVIIGDTPMDVQCAKPYGATCIAVATGPYSRENLRAAGAHHVLHNLSDTDSILCLLNENTQ